MIRDDSEVSRRREPEVGRCHAAFIGLVLVLAGGCSAGTPEPLAELVLREQLNEVPSDFVACVSVDGKDADEALLRALRGSARTIVPASECVWVLDTNKGSYERTSGRKAMLIDVRAYLARHEVEYVARHHGRWAVMLTLLVTQEQGRWQVVDVLKHEEA